MALSLKTQNMCPDRCFFGRTLALSSLEKHRCSAGAVCSYSWGRCSTFSLCMNNPQKAESHGATEMVYFIMS